jgi:hypothetical protein
LRDYLQDAVLEFRKTKALADKAMAQVSDADFVRSLDAETNSIAVVVKHLAGNMRSRWTDFLTTDGEKPDRNRDSEFVLDATDTRQQLLTRWESGWQIVFGAIEPLGAADLERIVTIRTEPHTVMQAINRQLTHYAYHVGQIVLLSKHFAAASWKPLSVPRGKSEEWNAATRRPR